ncbi:MAG: hypothetical protein VKJ46_15160 [Leptolyngbyaceae bacterium]|nr:hypothetical protein [Leptolyngbyaceae bacterium]
MDGQDHIDQVSDRLNNDVGVIAKNLASQVGATWVHRRRSQSKGHGSAMPLTGCLKSPLWSELMLIFRAHSTIQPAVANILEELMVHAATSHSLF